MADFDLKAKLGPLPVWGWGTIVGVALVLAWWLYAARSNSTTETEAAVQGVNLDPMGYQTTGITGGSAVSEPVTSTSDSYASNTEWLNTAARATASALAASPSAVYNALKKYINGETISATEQKYVDTAISDLGNPPEGTYGISDTIPDKPVEPTVVEKVVEKIVEVVKPAPAPKAPTKTTYWTGSGGVGWYYYNTYDDAYNGRYVKGRVIPDGTYRVLENRGGVLLIASPKGNVWVGTRRYPQSTFER